MGLPIAQGEHPPLTYDDTGYRHEVVPTLACAVCILRAVSPAAAITVHGGEAICLEHMGARRRAMIEDDELAR